MDGDPALRRNRGSVETIALNREAQRAYLGAGAVVAEPEDPVQLELRARRIESRYGPAAVAEILLAAYTGRDPAAAGGISSAPVLQESLS